MELVAAAEVHGGQIFGRVEGALVIDLQVQFEFFCEFVAQNDAGDPAVRSFVDGLIADLVVHINGAKFLGELKWQEERTVCGSDASARRIVGIVEEELRENRNGETGIPGIVETPLNTRIGLT